MQELKDNFEKSGGEWKEYKICGDDGIFYVRNTHSIQQSWIKPNSGDYPYVTASEANNSVISHISYDADFLEEGNSIMIGGKTLVVTYQENDYFSNDSHNLALYIKDERGKSEKSQLFLVSALYKSLKPKYSWGDSISYKKIQKDTVTLPTNSNGEIAFDFMEAYVRELEEERVRELAAYLKVCGLDDYTIAQGGVLQNRLNDFRTDKVIWKEFKIGELFEVSGNPQLNKESFKFSKNAKYPYFTRTVFNNGIFGNVEYLDKAHLIKGNSIAVGMLGMQFFYMQHDFYAGQFTKTVFPKFENFNEKIALYFAVQFNKFQKSYQGVLVRDFEKMFYNSVILLPIDSNNEIDFDFMQDFITAQEKLVIKNVILWKDKIIEKTKEVAQ